MGTSIKCNFTYMNKIIVMHLLSSRRFSGAENVVCQIINAFRSNNNIRMIYCCPDGPIREILEEKNILFESIESLSIQHVSSAINRIHPTVIHAHDMKASFVASLSTFKVPIVSHIHNNNFNSRKITLKALLYLYAGKRANHIYWVSRSSYEGYFFHSRLSDKSSILYNVIDYVQLENKAKEDLVDYDYDIVYIGRINYLKNPQRLIEILTKVVQLDSSVKIAIIGEGDLLDEAKELIKERSLEHNISCLGFCKNPYKILKGSKAMIMTSRTEGLPMCALEAMSLGVPIVTTPVGGLVELISNGEDGILSDDNDTMAFSLCRLVKDKNFQAELSIKARQKMERIMNIDRYKDELLKCYTACC